MSHLFTVKLKIVLTNGLACSIIYRNVNSSIAQATHIVCFHSLEIRLIVVIVIYIFDIYIDILDSSYIHSGRDANSCPVPDGVSPRCIVRLDLKAVGRA